MSQQLSDIHSTEVEELNSIEDVDTDLEEILDEPLVKDVKKKERVVPFNVLMLKSDKEKLKKTVQQLSTPDRPMKKERVPENINVEKLSSTR